jgi:hypothetical protein
MGGLQLLAPQRDSLAAQEQQIAGVGDRPQAHDVPLLRGDHAAFGIGKAPQGTA